MLAKLTFFWYLLLIATGQYEEEPARPWQVYSAWTDTGIHLIMTDAGTDTPEDDFVIDWEDNRQFKVTIID